VPIVLKSGSLNFLEPSGPVQACNGIALPFTCICTSRISFKLYEYVFNLSLISFIFIRSYNVYCTIDLINVVLAALLFPSYFIIFQFSHPCRRISITSIVHNSTHCSLFQICASSNVAYYTNHCYLYRALCHIHCVTVWSNTVFLVSVKVVTYHLNWLGRQCEKRRCTIRMTLHTIFPTA
jgi:hypothetical protein